MDRIGRKNTQLYSFLCQAIFGFILGQCSALTQHTSPFHSSTSIIVLILTTFSIPGGALGPIQSVFPLFIVMYGLFLSLGEAVGSTTLLISSEVSANATYQIN